MEVDYEIVGYENMKTIFEEYPEKFGKNVLRSAFKKGAKPFIAALKKSTPVKTGETLKAIKALNTRGAGIKVGFTGKKEYMWGYMKAYWSNYGTLANRDRSHTFKQRRKSKTANRQGGVIPKRFVEESWETNRDQMEKNTIVEIMNVSQKFLNKHKVA